MREIIAAEHAVPPRGRSRATRRSSSSRRWARPSRSSIIERIPEDEEIIALPPRRAGDDEWVDLCEGPHVPQHRLPRRGEAHQRRRRVLARRRAQPDAPAHLRHRVPDRRRRSTSTSSCSKRRKARDHRKLGKELELFMFHEYAPAMPFFLPRGAHVYNRLVDYMRNLYASYGYEEVITPQIFDKRALRDQRAPRQLQREHVLAVTETRGRVIERARPPTRGTARKAARTRAALGAQADELPEPLPDLRRSAAAATASCRGASPTSGACIATSAAASCTASPACARFCQDDAHIFCTPEQMRGGDRARSSSCSTGSTRRFGFSNVDVKLAHAAREAHRHRRAVGRAPRSALARRARRARAAVRDLAGRGRVLRPEDRVPRPGRARPQLAARHHPARLRTCPSASSSSTSATTARRTGRSCSTARSSARSSASSASTSSTCAGDFPVWLAPEQVTLVTVSEKQVEYAARSQRVAAAARGFASLATWEPTSSAPRFATRA